VHNPIVSVVDVAQMNGMEAPYFVSLKVFGVAEAGENEARLSFIIFVLRRRHR
jgi:hypothetical protein